MSHFCVLVIGNDPEKQLAPYQENNMGNCPKEYLDFNNVEDEERKNYETGTTKEFYCNSSSSWGFQVTDIVYKQLEEIKINEEIEYVRNGKNSFNYFTLGKKYIVYYS